MHMHMRLQGQKQRAAAQAAAERAAAEQRQRAAAERAAAERAAAERAAAERAAAAKRAAAERAAAAKRAAAEQRQRAAEQRQQAEAAELARLLRQRDAEQRQRAAAERAAAAQRADVVEAAEVAEAVAAVEAAEAAERAAAERAAQQRGAPTAQAGEVCIICFDAPRAVVFGCGHACCCRGCAEELQRRRQPCPVCRQPLGRLVAAAGACVCYACGCGCGHGVCVRACAWCTRSVCMGYPRRLHGMYTSAESCSLLAAGPVLQTNANAPPAPRRAGAARPQPAQPPAARAAVGVSAFEQAFAPRTVGAVAALAALFELVSLWTAVALWALALVATWWPRRRAAAPPALPAAGTPAQRQPPRAPAAAAAAPVPELPQIGEIRFDNPRLRLGEGSFGVVFRSAERGWQGVTVAVKELRTEGPVPPAVQDELNREAAILASLRHPNVISLYGVRFQPGASPQIITEYAPGGNLQDALYPRNGGRSPLTQQQKRQVALDTAAGLLHIHAKPLVHRDLKPANVLLAADGSAKVADMGLARGTSGTRGYMTATRAAGTPVYMAPEQWEGAALSTKVNLPRH